MNDAGGELVRPSEVGSEQSGGAAGAPEPGVVTPSQRAPRGRRRRQTGGRPHAVLVRLSDQEYEVLGTAAAARGLTVTSFVATQALAVAGGVVHPLPSSVGDVVWELVLARTQLTRYGVLLNQAVVRLHVTGELDAGLALALQRCDEAIAAVRFATQRLGC
ncbi:MAG: hypothetical protein JWO60_343 [Frankiales bacterium]|nr:hypothetical protein [Frankiales bacterium]